MWKDELDNVGIYKPHVDKLATTLLRDNLDTIGGILSCPSEYIQEIGRSLGECEKILQGNMKLVEVKSKLY